MRDCCPSTAVPPLNSHTSHLHCLLIALIRLLYPAAEHGSPLIDLVHLPKPFTNTLACLPRSLSNFSVSPCSPRPPLSPPWSCRMPCADHHALPHLLPRSAVRPEASGPPHLRIRSSECQQQHQQQQLPLFTKSYLIPGHPQCRALHQLVPLMGWTQPPAPCPVRSGGS